MCFGCSYKGPQNANDVQSTEACEEEEPQSYTPIYVPKPNVDTETRVVDEAKQQSISGDNKNNRKICGDIKVNSYYDEGNFERSQCTILHISGISNALFYIFWGVTNALFYIFRAFPMPYFTCFEHFQCLKKGGTVSEPYHASYYTVL